MRRGNVEKKSISQKQLRNTARTTRPVGMADGDGVEKLAGSIRTGEDCLSEVPLISFYSAG